jgi:hypothetical protein
MFASPSWFLPILISDTGYSSHNRAARQQQNPQAVRNYFGLDCGSEGDDDQTRVRVTRHPYDVQQRQGAGSGIEHEMW